MFLFTFDEMERRAKRGHRISLGQVNRQINAQPVKAENVRTELV